MTQASPHKLTRNVIPPSWSRTSQYSVRAITWLFQKAYNIMQQLGTTTTCSTLVQSVQKKLFVSQEETFGISMYWKGIKTTVQSHVKKCHSCQVNKPRLHIYGKLSTKLAIAKPWEALCVDLIGPYTLKAKAKTQIDFMCITMFDPATIVGSKLQSCQYHSYLSLMFPWKQTGNRAKTHISNSNNPTLTRRQQQQVT